MDQNQTLEILLVIAIVVLALMQITLGLTVLLLIRRVRSVVRRVDKAAEVIKTTVIKTRFLPTIVNLGRAGFRAIKAKPE